MSNLGGYQVATQFIKFVHGPKNAVRLGVAAAGGIFVAGGLAHAGGQKAIQAIKEKLAEKKDFTAEQLFEVLVDGEDSAGLKLKVGIKFRVLDRDEDAVLIEVLGDENNPYFTSAKFLASVSGYQTAAHDDGDQQEPDNPASPGPLTSKD